MISGWRRRISTGSTAWAIATASPDRAQPANSGAHPPAPRSPAAPAVSSRQASSTRSIETRRVSRGPSGAKAPNASTGSVVSSPAASPDRPRSACTWVSSGGRLATSVRRLSASSTIAVIAPAAARRRAAADPPGEIGPATESATRLTRLRTQGARRDELRRRQIRVKGRLLAGHDVRRHRSDELAERGAARVIGEQRPALQPRGELGLQIEPDPERRVAEDVMYDSKLVDDAAFLATEQRMRFVTRDHPERRERHRPVLAKLGT